MTGIIELRVQGDPASVAEAVRGAQTVLDALDATERDLSKALRDSGSWTGSASDAFRTTIEEIRNDVVELHERVEGVKRGLDTFVDELTLVKHKLADVRDFATGHGLIVMGETVMPPTAPAGEVGPAVARAHDAKLPGWNRAVEMAEAARQSEKRAHNDLGSTLKKADGDGWLEDVAEFLGLWAPDGVDAVASGGFVGSLGLLGFGVSADVFKYVERGRWQPFTKVPSASSPTGWKWQLGTINTTAYTWGERFRSGFRGEKDWRAKPCQAASRSRWATAGKLASRAGWPITAATSGWDQWQADADDPTLDSGEKLDRAATKATTTTGMAIAGAEGGAYVGSAIGTAICPGAGTVVGGAVGGIVGGAAGAFAGSEVGDYVNEKFDGAVHAVGDGLGAAGDALSDAGDALTFWD